MWNLESGEIVKILSQFKTGIFKVKVINDSNYIAIADENCKFSIWDFEEDRLIQQQQEHIDNFAITKNERYIVTTNYKDNISVWGGIDTIKAHKGSILCIATC